MTFRGQGVSSSNVSSYRQEATLTAGASLFGALRGRLHLTRYKHTSRLIGLTGLLSVMAFGLSAIPSGATIVCPKGTTDPRYCINVLPIATTGPATQRKGTSAVLNGTAGPGVEGGDVTQYFFQYGRSTAYGHTTPPGTVGNCPNGQTRCPSVRKYKVVSAKVRHLRPCTRYHFRIVAHNPDGTSHGKDRHFNSGFARPIKRVKRPSHVQHNAEFKVKITLAFRARVTIKIRRHGHDVKTYHVGSKPKGSFSKTIQAPASSGKYTLRVVAKLSCGQQKKDRDLHVN
jgi:hypothetical protein